MNGGTGARPDGDGVSTMDELVINVMNTPVEAVESEFPVRIERYDLPIDSGGAGTFRGGLGTRRQWRVLAEETTVNLRTDRFKFCLAGRVRRKAARSRPTPSLESGSAASAAADLEGRWPAAQERRPADRSNSPAAAAGAIRARAIPSACARTWCRLCLVRRRPRAITAWRSIHERMRRHRRKQDRAARDARPRS